MKRLILIIFAILTLNLNFARAEQGAAAPNQCQEADTNPVPLRYINLARIYPSAAIERGITDELLLKLNVNEAGSVTGAEIIESREPRLFGPPAIREAMKMKFTPARKNCINIASTYDLKITFSLDN